MKASADKSSWNFPAAFTTLKRKRCRLASRACSNASISTNDRLRRLEAYSKGMRQKILIGAALLHNPQLILLDEPLTGLDVDAQIMVKDLIAALAKDGKTILYSSHILEVVERVCDRVLIIHKGDLIADASVPELRETDASSQS